MPAHSGVYGKAAIKALQGGLFKDMAIGLGLGLIGGAVWKGYHLREQALIAQANAQAEAAVAQAAAAGVYAQ